MNAKVRRVDFYPDDWLGGTSELTVLECGVYWTACALIYNRGGPIERVHLRHVCGGHARPFSAALDRLLALGKLVADGDMLDQVRCEKELIRAQERIESARIKAGKRWQGANQNNEVGSAGASAGQMPGKNGRSAVKTDETSSKHERNIEQTSSKHRRNLRPQSRKTKGIANAGDDARARDRQSQEPSALIKNLRGDSALGCASGEAAPPEPHSAEDKAAVDRILGEVRDILQLPASGLRNGTYNPGAYRKAISVTKRDTWLNNLATFAGEALPGLPEKMAAWEAIEAARNAGSRNATPPDIRRALDQLSRLRDQKLAYAEAAE